jgi:hypothetical protein
MATSISLDWAKCHVVAKGAGWTRLVNVPEHLVIIAIARLMQLGAKHITEVESGTISFRAGSTVCTHLVNVFPCCPLA